MANGAAELGLFSRATMAVGQALEDGGYRRHRRDALMTPPEDMSEENMPRWVAGFATFWPLIGVLPLSPALRELIGLEIWKPNNLSGRLHLPRNSPKE